MRLLLVLPLATAACGSDLNAPKQHLAVSENPTFTLMISNQSFDLDPVDIEIALDGRRAVTGDFVVGSQHTWVKFDFDLGVGTHTLTAKSADAGVELEKQFVMDDRKWGVVNFWFYERETPEHFDFQLYDAAPAFE